MSRPASSTPKSPLRASTMSLLAPSTVPEEPESPSRDADAATLVDDPADVAQVPLARGDALGQVGRADALVPGHDDLRVQGGDGVQVVDPCTLCHSARTAVAKRG